MSTLFREDLNSCCTTGGLSSVVNVAAACRLVGQQWSLDGLEQLSGNLDAPEQMPSGSHKGFVLSIGGTCAYATTIRRD